MRLEPTGRTIAQEWDIADNARRGEMLAEFEVGVVLHPDRARTACGGYWDGDQPGRGGAYRLTDQHGDETTRHLPR
jgi:hypothetical protein